MHFRFLNVFTTLLSLLFCAQIGMAQDLDDLPKTIEALSSQKTDEVIRALDVMTRICDESCTPFLTDMLRHHDHDVVLAACHTAQILANPKLAPVLQEIIKKYPLDDVRLEALKALTRTGVGYDSLFMTIDPGHPDELQKRILRNLPQELAEQYVSNFVSLAGFHPYSTSVAAAYARTPELIAEPLVLAIQNANPDTRHNLLRTLSLIAPKLKSFPAQMIEVFRHEPDTDLDLMASILADQSDPQALNLLLLWIDKLSSTSLLNVLNRLHGEGAALFTDAVLHEKNIEVRQLIEQNPALMLAFIKKLPAESSSRDYAVSLLNHPEYRASAIFFLGQFAEVQAIYQVIWDALGSMIQSQAVSALRATLQSDVFWPALFQNILDHSEIDEFGRTYLARWAIALAVSSSSLPVQAIPEEIFREAQTCIRDTKRLHAEPALWLLHYARRIDTLPEPAAFHQMRPDMQVAWFKVMSSEKAGNYLPMAIKSHDSVIISAALDKLYHFPELASAFEKQELTSILIDVITSSSSMIAVQGAATAAKLQCTACLDALYRRLTDADSRVAYNALWALQKLHALPNDVLLRSLYYRAPDGVLRDRLGFLTGLDPNSQERIPMTILDNNQPIQEGQMTQLLSQGEPQAGREIAIMTAEQSIRIVKTNVLGMLIL